jgi:long-chain acyl-CoA synthetase
MLVHRFLEDAARRTPDAIALIDERTSLTYVELNALANRFARVFLSAGARRGDRIAIALENGPEFVGAYLGAMKAGAIAVPLSAAANDDRLDRALEECSPVVYLCEANRRVPATTDSKRVVLVHSRAAGRSIPTEGAGDLGTALDACSDQPVTANSIDLDLATIIYTSGSTGEPRGVMLTHRNLVANARSIVKYLGLTALDRVMCVLPLHYVYGLSLLHTHLAVGGSIAIDNRFAFPNVVLEAMREHRVTGFAGVPSTFMLLLHRSSIEEFSSPTLRYVTQAGGSMPVVRLREWRERGPRVPFFVMYGATEAAARLTYLDPAKLVEKEGSIGRAIPNVEVVVRRDDDSIAAPGEVGELVARGSNISIGYWQRPSDTLERFTRQGYRTGDLGYCDEDGFLFLVGRRHEMIKVGAHRVGAKEIEDVLHEFPGSHEAAVVSIPHDILGEAPVAFISLRHSAETDVEALRAHCGKRLPPYKIPIRFVIVPEMPKTSDVGKIDRLALRELALQDNESVS